MLSGSRLPCALLFPVLCTSLAFSPHTPLVAHPLGECSADSLRETVTSPVACSVRHTLSDTTKAHAGIGVARSWMKDRFERYAAASGGRLRIALQERMSVPTQRVPTPVNIVNVILISVPSLFQEPR